MYKKPVAFAPSVAPPAFNSHSKSLYVTALLVGFGFGFGFGVSYCTALLSESVAAAAAYHLFVFSSLNCAAIRRAHKEATATTVLCTFPFGMVGSTLASAT